MNVIGKTLFVLAIMLASGHSYAQQIKPEEAKNHIGDSLTVCGSVDGGKYLENANRQPTLLDMGGSYPNQALTLLIWGDNRSRFSYKPEEALRGKEVCVTGKIILYKDKPEIILDSEAQVKVKQ
jgi:micrococcal nuclease